MLYPVAGAVAPASTARAPQDLRSNWTFAEGAGATASHASGNNQEKIERGGWHA
jgi:hypothetical protein